MLTSTGHTLTGISVSTRSTPFLCCIHSILCVFVLQSIFGDGENTKVRVAELEEEVQTLKKINKDLYDFSSQLLTKPT